MKLQLITLLGSKVDRDAYEVIIPTLDGEIGVFPGHEPLVSVAKPGAITVRYDKADNDDKLDFFAISGGVVEVNQEHVRVLVDEADNGKDIVETESKQALDRALKLQAEAKIRWNLRRLKQWLIVIKCV